MWTIKSRHIRHVLLLFLHILVPLTVQYGSEASIQVVIITLLHVGVYVVTVYHQKLLPQLDSQFRLPYLVDIPLTLLEIGAYLYLWRRFTSADPAFLSLTVFDLANSVVLLLIGYFKLSDVINTGNFRWSASYDFLAAKIWSPDPRQRRRFFAGFTRSWPLIALDTCCLWVGFITVAFAWNAIVLAPLRETDSIPIREFRSLKYPANLKHNGSSAWRVILGRVQSVGSDGRDEDWSSAVKVILLLNESQSEPCPLSAGQAPLPSKELPFSTTTMSLSVITFQCPYQTDVLVTVNFTKLGIASNSVANGGTNSVQIMVGSIADVVRRKETPALLLPGMNIVGFAKQYILQQFKNRPLSTFGLFASYETILLSEISNLGSDPQASRSPLITLAPDIATIRIIPLVDYSDWRVVQEYRDRSVLKGFSTIGGLWTFFGSILVVLFGKSVFQFLYNTKPLSAFGLVHQFNRESIELAFRKKYPDIESDLNRRGFAAFMAEHLVDVDFIMPLDTTVPQWTFWNISEDERQRDSREDTSDVPQDCPPMSHRSAET